MAATTCQYAAAVTKHTITMMHSTSAQNRPRTPCTCTASGTAVQAVQALVVTDGVGGPALMLLLKLEYDVVDDIFPAVCLVQLQAFNDCTAVAHAAAQQRHSRGALIDDALADSTAAAYCLYITRGTCSLATSLAC